MAHHFQLVGNGLRYSWQKECPPEEAVHHAKQVADEFAPDECYRGVSIRVTDDRGRELTVVPIRSV
jgi:hypothetical protein